MDSMEEENTLKQQVAEQSTRLAEQSAEIQELKQQLAKLKQTEDDETDCPVPRPPTKRKRSDIEKLRAGDLSPSAATWDVLLFEEVVVAFHTFLVDLSEVTNKCEIKPQCFGKDLDTYKGLIELAKKRLACHNEGFPTILCGIMLLHIVDHLHSQEDERKYHLTIYPVVKKFSDERKNKKSDYVLVRLSNERSMIIFELKLSVGAVIAGCKDALAQLFLEVKYAAEEDRSSGRRYDTMIGVLADHVSWHVLLIDLRKPFRVLQYFHLNDPQIEDLCSLIKQLSLELK